MTRIRFSENITQEVMHMAITHAFAPGDYMEAMNDNRELLEYPCNCGYCQQPYRDWVFGQWLERNSLDDGPELK